MIRRHHKDENYKKVTIDFVRKHIDEINKSNYLDNTRKIQMNLLINSYPLYVITYKLYLKICRK